MIASSSATTTRTGLVTTEGLSVLRAGSDRSERRLLRSHAVEKGILLAFELGDRTDERVALTAERIGVTAALAGVGIGERGFGYEGAQPGGVGFFFHVDQLLLGHGEIGAEATQTVADVDEPPLQERVGHPSILRAAARDGPGLETTAARPLRGVGVKNADRRVRKTLRHRHDTPFGATTVVCHMNGPSTRL